MAVRNKISADHATRVTEAVPAMTFICRARKLDAF